MQSILSIKPLKSLPQRIIYKAPYKNGSNIYLMFDTKSCNKVGTMVGNVTTETMFSNYYPSFASYKSFKIHDLIIDEKRKGHGSAFIKLARAESLRQGANGRVHLDAGKIHDPMNPPHVFYRKLGFLTRFADTLAKIDKAIKKNKQIAPEDAVDIPMFLCPKAKVIHSKPTFFQKLKSILKGL